MLGIRLLTTAVTIGALGLAGCRADREALDPPGGEPVDLSPDPRIEAAPAYPTPPGEAPVGLHPDTAPRPEVDLDTIPGEFPDTL
jgi:hypothetical protein